MNRREFITLLGGAAAAWPLAVYAQVVSTVRRIGFLLPGVARTTAVRGLLEAFRQGLKEHGWLEGQNLSVEYRFAEGKEDLLPEIAAELVQLRLEIIVAEGTAAIQAAKNAMQTVPIVMATSNDPIGSGLIASLNRPGGNITGLSLQTQDLGGKRLQLLTEIVPGLARVAVLSNPQIPAASQTCSRCKLRRNRWASSFMSWRCGRLTGSRAHSPRSPRHAQAPSSCCQMACCIVNILVS
jgi:putative tryptophan/tyrosine transport system substrate-binding protein